MSFECAECGYETMKWLGKCPACSEWNTFVELSEEEVDENAPRADIINLSARTLSEVDIAETARFSTGFSGLDRILGGGAVPGAILLLGGAPGVGKSTLFLQLAGKISGTGKSVLYVSGEESSSQIKIHANRLNIKGDNIKVLSSGSILNIRKEAEAKQPDVIFIDSVQAVADPSGSGAPGTVKQVKMSGQALTVLAKNTGATVFLSGQITKQGDIAGPKLLEHMVDAVLYMEALEGKERVISAEKNRFGSCGDFLLLSMEEKGLLEVETPENTLLERGDSITGRAFTSFRGGRRLTTAEIQVLISEGCFEYPLRRTSGYSRERLLMLAAIAGKYLSLRMGALDIYMNVSGVRKMTERSGDLAAIAALYSASRDIPLPGDILFEGEVGLSGDVRPLQDASERYKFALRNGFSRIILSERNTRIRENSSTKCIYIGKLKELADFLRSLNNNPH